MENDEWTIETNFGLGDTPKRKISFYKALEGNDQVKKTIESLDKSIDDLRILMLDVQKSNPEYYNKLVEVHRKMVGLKINLTHQFNGGIAYA